MDGSVERCWRCSEPMHWVHGTWQCPRCRFKLGCCEGEPACSADAEPAPPAVDAAVR
jgi:hypothetical protein